MKCVLNIMSHGHQGIRARILWNKVKIFPVRKLVPRNKIFTGKPYINGDSSIRII